MRPTRLRAASPLLPGARTVPSAALVVLLLGACSVLPGGSDPADPWSGDCAVVIRNDVDWGLRVRVQAPDGRPPIIFEREIRYVERDGQRTLSVPCTYRSALVVGDVRRISGLSGQQPTRFRTGICLVPDEPALAVLDEYGEWDERWWTQCPDPEPPKGDSVPHSGSVPHPGGG